MFNKNPTSAFAFMIMLFSIYLGRNNEQPELQALIALSIFFCGILIVLGFVEAHERINRKPIVLPAIHRVEEEEEVCDRLWILASTGIVETFESMPSGRAWMTIDGVVKYRGTLRAVNTLAWEEMRNR